MAIQKGGVGVKNEKVVRELRGRKNISSTISIPFLFSIALYSLLPRIEASKIVYRNTGHAKNTQYRDTGKMKPPTMFWRDFAVYVNFMSKTSIFK